MPAELLGVGGMLMILGGWLASLKAPPPHPRLSLLYALGSLMLTAYALLIGDPVFTVLNAAASLLSAVNVLRFLRSGGSR